MCSFEKVFANINLSTAAGFSFPGKKKSEVAMDAYMMSRNMLHKLKNGFPLWWPYCTIAFRGHLKPVDEPKTRPVWIQPFEVVILEQYFGRCLIDMY
jgi:hypothetical protein